MTGRLFTSQKFIKLGCLACCCTILLALSGCAAAENTSPARQLCLGRLPLQAAHQL